MAENQGSPISARAIVAYDPIDGKPNLKLQDVTFRALGPNEVLVKLVATGYCHTDLVFSSVGPEMGPYPKVLGHEGAGYVQQIGSGVQNSIVGDSVLLSFQSCASCKDCKDGHPSYCQSFSAANYGGEQELFQIADGGKASGFFFGQSSFSSYAIVKESSVVKVTDLVDNEEQLKLFAPLGCGFQTGIGTVDILTAAGKTDAIVILGLGGVGLSAIMAAKIKECSVIIGVDRFDERLELATSFGATHVINTSTLEGSVVDKIRSLTGGVGPSITIDTTGNMGLIGNGMEFTANRGQMILLGVPPMDGLLSVHLVPFMQTGKLLRGSIEGDVTPSEFIPKMIKWYKEGKLPIEKLVKFYPVEDFEKALSDMHSGVSVKPVLVW